MDMGGHNRGGASKMFLVETKSGHSITNYLGRGHKDKTRGAGDYSLAREKFISQSHKSRHNVPISDHSRKLSACTSCEGCKKIKCTETAKCYWDDDEEECVSHDCIEDADCIGQKFDYDDFEVAEEGDMYCEMYEDGNECEPADCNVCEGCKDFRCESTQACALIKKSGENTTTCVSNLCKTNEDCQTFIGNIVLDMSEDSEIEDGDMICDKEDKYCTVASCTSCEGCKKIKCKESAKCYWDDDERECASEVCVEDADCIGQKINDDVTEEGDMTCQMHYNANECEPADCKVCEGCKDFRCRETKICAAVQKPGENRTTCISRSCKTDEDCKKFNGNIVLDKSEDSEIEDGDLICDKEDKHCNGAPCTSCEGCKKNNVYGDCKMLLA